MRAAPPVTGTGSGTTRRPAVDGLRGVAVALVVVHHVWVGRVSGGVDVFFVLTGFFLTASLVREVDRTGRVRVRAYAGRLARRSLPAAGSVLAVTAVVSALVLPRTRWADTAPQFLASLGFVENWFLALGSVQYGVDPGAASPVQHFWSLAVQGQVYVLWPLLLVVGATALRRSAVDARQAAAVALAAVAALSLTWSVARTATAPAAAYFDTAGRLWEFAAGGMLALAGDRLTLPDRVRRVLGWAGLVGLLVVGVLVDASRYLPGWWAVGPVACALAVLIGTAPAHPRGVGRLLGTRPATWLGGRSYALYLWHWPVLVWYLQVTGRAVPSGRGGLYVVVTSLVLADVTVRALAPALRTGPRAGGAPPRRTRVVAAVAVAPALVAGLVWTGYVHVGSRGAAIPAGDPDHPGALALAPGFVYQGDPGAVLAPDAVALGSDTTWSDQAQRRWSCDSPATSTVEYCTAPDTEGAPLQVVVAGDSHAAQLLQAVLAVAGHRGYRVVDATKGGCALTLDPVHLDDDPAARASCLRHNEDLVADLLRTPPHLVVTVGSRASPDSAEETTPDGYQGAWDALATAGIPVLAVRDNARFALDPNQCLERAGGDASRCTFARDGAYRSPDPLAAAAAGRPLVQALDIVPLLCDEAGTCGTAIGNVRVYRDHNHLSGSYVRTMAPWFDEVLDAAGW